MAKREPNYCRTLIIVHGLSEYQMCEYIKQNLRMPIEIYGDKNGKKSIQISSLMGTLNDHNHKSLHNFYNTYNSVKLSGRGKKQQIENFKIFIIMDVDDCTEQERDRYINKSMFKGHWALDYIEPLFNKLNLEDVMKSCAIPFDNKQSKSSQYISIFPTDKKHIKNDSMQILEFYNAIKSSSKTNMELLFEYIFKGTKYENQI